MTIIIVECLMLEVQAEEICKEPSIKDVRTKSRFPLVRNGQTPKPPPDCERFYGQTLIAI